MPLKLKQLLSLWIFIQGINIADSYYAELTDLGKATTYHNLSNYQWNNCSIYTIAYGSSCTCFECDDERCTICCNSPGFRCCYCRACVTSCWKNNWQILSLAQVGLSTALLIATVATIALFFRVCSSGLSFTQRSNRSLTSFIRDDSGRISVSSMQQYIIGRLRDRPPRYNDLTDAPPVYDTDPTNRAATSDAPPNYTRTAQAPSEIINNEILTTTTTTTTPTPSTPELPTSTHHM